MQQKTQKENEYRIKLKLEEETGVIGYGCQ